MHKKIQSAARKGTVGVLAASVLAAACLLLTTCNIFKSGLGSKVDVTPPEIVITTPVQGSYVHGTVVLTGTAADDIGVTSLTVSYPTNGGGTAEKAAALTGNQWTVSLPSGGAGQLAEGKSTITVTAKAASGKDATASVLTYVDNTPPAVLVTTPTTYGGSPPIFSSYVDISGEAYDASPIASVSVTLSYLDGVPKTITQPANGANSWSVRFLLNTSAGGPLGLANDHVVLSYSVTVTDIAGNANSYYYHSQDIYNLLALSFPGKLFPTMLELGQLDQGGASPSSPTGITIAQLSGKQIPNAQANRGNLQFSNAFVPLIQYSNLDPANPPVNVLAPGSVIVGNVLPPANAAVDPSTLVFKIFTPANFPAGTPEVTLTAASPLGTQLVLTNLGSSQGFKVALQNSTGVNLAPGQYVLRVAAQAFGSFDIATSDINFGIDSSAPTLTETSVGNSLALLRSKFALAGLAASLSGLNTLKVDESADGGQNWTNPYSNTYAGNPTTDNWTTPAASLPNPGADGSYSFRITLTTTSGLTAIVYRSVIFDSTPPYVNVTSPTLGAWTSSSTPAVSGTAGDGSGSGVSSVYYLIDSAATDHAPEIATWASLAGPGAPTGSWTLASGVVSSWTASPTLLSEGLKRLWVVAVDQAGNRGPALVPANLLVAGQKYTIETIGTTNFMLVGAASNTVGLSFTATAAGIGTGTAWTGGGPVITFGYDQNPPTLTETHAAATTFTAATAGSFLHFDGTVSDSDALAGLSVQYSKNGVPQTPAAITPAGNAWSWTPFASGIDVAGHTNDGSYSFTFTATDIAGKTTTVSRTMTVDTQAPTVAVTSPTANGWVSTTALSVTGTAGDGAGSGVSQVYLKVDGLYVPATGTDHSAEDPVVSGWTVATGLTSWSSSFTLAGEGRKTLWVKAADAVGNVTTTAGAIASRIDFGLDLNPPTLGFTDAVGTLVSAGFTLTGTTTDTNPAGASTLAVVVDGGASQAVPVAAGAWTFPVAVNTVTHANDGSHTYVFTATDVAGKTTTLSRTITVDTTPPATTISLPGSYVPAQAQYWLSGATASLGGTAADPGASPSGVAKVYFNVDALGNNHASDDPVAAGWTLATGTTNWSASANLATLGEGQFTLWTAAFDNAGNLSAIASRNFGVDQNPPTLTETNHAAISATKSAFTLAGAIGDTNALASLAITESKNAGPLNAVTFASVPASLAGVTSATYTSQSLPLGGVVDGSYAYVLTATDAAGKTTLVNRTVNIDTTPPTVNLTAIPAWVNSSAYTISGSAADPNAGASGVSVIQYQLDGGAWMNAAWTDTSGGANTTGTWNATLSALAEGNHSIILRATDAAANTTTLGASAFGVDLNPPTLTETALGTTSQVTKNGAFTMTGTVSDTNPVSVAGTTLTVSVSVNGGAASAAAIVGSTWSFTQPKVDGIYSYVITATDASGKTATLNRLVLLDSTPPTLTVTTPTPTPATWVSSTSLSISGASNDGAGSGVKNTYYLVDIASNDHSPEIAAWNLTSGASAPTGSWAAATGLPGNWSGSNTLSGEGAKILWIVTADNAGNTTALSKVAAGSFNTGTVYTIAAIGTTNFVAIGAASNTVGLAFTATGAGAGTGSAWAGTGIAIPFGLDLNPPPLTETGINTTSTVVKNGSVNFSGSASDTNALAAAHFLTVSVDGGAAADVSFTVAPNWSSTYNVDTVTHAQDGTHTFLFTATDVAGKTTTVARTILVDTTPATAAVTSPAGGWTGASPFTVTGTAADGAGSGVSQVWTIVDIQGNSHAADTPTTITTGGAWKQATGTGNWTWSWTLAPEGNKTVWVAVLDGAGNWSTTYTTVNFGYDATPPVLTIVPMGGYKAAFAITGTVSDAASGVSVLQYKIDSGAMNPVTVAANWSAPIPIADFNALSEGLHTVTVQATDSASNQSTQVSTFSKDTTPPSLAYSNISSGGGTVDQDTNPVLTGTLTDVSGVASATYTLQVWNYSTQAWNAIATGASLGSPSGTSWPWLLDLSATGLNLPDGKYQVAIGAADVPGNAIAAPLQVPFFLSRTNPGTAIAAPSLGTFQDGAFPLTGTASDSNGVTLVRAKIAAGSVDFSSGTTAALPALPVIAATGSPGVFTTNAPHGLVALDQVYIWGTPMPVTPAGSLVPGTGYYVKTATASTFTISATSGGAELDITTSAATNLIVAAPKYSFATFHIAIPVTVSGSTMTANNHQLVNGDVVYFQGTTLPAPTSAAAAYYVVNAGANTFQVSTTSGGSVLPLTTAGSGVSVFSPTHPVSWLIPAMSTLGFSDGPLTAYVQAAAGSNKTGQTSRDFTLDTAAPTIALSSPSSGTRSVGNLTLIGTTTDGGAIPSGVTGTIEYQIGKNYNLGNPASWTSANVSGGSYSWTITLGDMSSYANATFATECDTGGLPASGTNLWKLPIVYQALDKAGNVAQLTTYYLILDPNGNVPVVTITQPATGLTFGGQQTITGTATQPVAIYGVEVAVDPNGGNNFPANPVSVSVPGGGQTITAAAHPLTNGMMVFLSGTTAPQIGGIPVLSTTPYWVINRTANDFQLSAASGGSAVTFSSAGTGVSASVWAPATLTTTGNNVIWYYNINTTGAYPQGASSQTISLQARAWNSPTVGGPKGTISGLLTAPWVLTFNSSFPQVQNVQVNAQSYYSQITTSGTVSFTATVSSSKGIAKIETVEGSPLSGSTTMYNTANSYLTTVAANGSYWSSTVTPPASQNNVTFLNGNPYKVMITATGSDGSLWTSAGAPSSAPGTVFLPNNVTINVSSTAGSFIESDASGNFNYAVSMSINSTQLYAGTTGQYVFNIRATDMTSPVAQITNQPITLNEDNYYPTSTIASSSSIVGSQFVVQGSAIDSGGGSGPISGFSKVVVYFVRAGSVLNLSTGANGATSSITAKDMNNGGIIGSVPYPGIGGFLKLSIDTLAENNTLPTGGGTDVNGDGFMESLTINGSSYTWMGQVDSTKIADGPVEVHYVAFDSAGNATHYVQPSTVGNYAPSLSTVVLGTDLTGAGAINTTSSFSSGFAATNFIVRNRLMSFQINSNYGGQNGALGYSLKYAGTEYWANAPASGETVSGVTANSATLTLDFTKLSPAIPDSAVNGASFTLTVTATPAAGGTQTYTQVINLTVQNTDTTPPTIAAAPFGQRYNVPTDAGNGGVYTDTGKSLGTVLAYADNVATSGSTLLGHVEYAGNSIFADSQPNLSGQVIYRGKVYDNQRISRITATIAGFNGGNGAGVEFEIAKWGGAALTPESGTGWSFATDSSSEGVSLPDGHVLNWSFTWDSSAITTVAAKNVAVTFKAYDFMTTGTGAARAASTITSSLFAGMGIPSGTPIYLFGGTTPTWTTTNGAQAGNTLTLTNATINTDNTSFIVSNAPASSAMTVDVVPYITGISNPAGQGLTNDVIRSSTGKYSIDVNGANRFNVAGFNLGAAGYLPTAYVSAAPISTPSGQNPAATFVSSTSIQVAKTMAAVRSGWLTVFVNAVPSANNLNSNASSVAGTFYNTEVNPAIPVSSQWTDDRYLWLWSITTLNGGAFNNQTYYYPDMIVTAGQPIFTYDNDNDGYNYRTTSDTTRVQKVGRWYERQGALAINSSGTYYIASAEDAFSGGTIGSLQINRDVGLAASIGAAASNADNVYEMINEDYISRQLNRFRYPRLIAEGLDASTQLYSVVYDAHPSQNLLYFFSFQNTGPGADNLTEVAANGGIAANGYVALPGTQNNSSQYFAMAKIGAGTGAPIAVAYYDNTATQLKLIYSSNHTTAGNLANAGATWTTMVVDSNLYAGTNVSMTTDGTDLYLAYYDSANADLKFARITWATKAVQIYTIDSYLSVGTWTGIQVFNGVPYITYYSDSFNGTSKPVRMAFPTNGTGGVSAGNTTTNGANPATEAFTGTWEVVTLPASSAPKGGMEQFNHVQLGNYTNNALTLPVVGYLANYLEYAKLQPNN